MPKQLKCAECGGDVDDLNYCCYITFTSDDPQDPDFFNEEWGDEVFCSRKCIRDDYSRKEDISDNTQIFEISKCPIYHDCEYLNNLRGRCTHKKNITPQESSTPFNIDISSFTNPLAWCDPGFASIIKATIALIKSNKTITRLTIVLIVLTLVLIAVTIVLIFIGILSFPGIQLLPHIQLPMKAFETV